MLVIVPVAQAPVPVGVEVTYFPFLEPQTPATGRAPVAQVVLVPEYCPVQVQDQGPEPETEDAVPVAQRLVEG